MARSRLGLEGAGEWETLEPMLPDFAGKQVLDLGCGYGWHCVYAAAHRAAAVTGVDLSESMLAVAQEKAADFPQVTYLRGAIEDVDFPADNYFLEGRRNAVFLGEPVVKYHRTLTTYLDSLLTTGFQLLRLAEPQPPVRMLDMPGMRDELRRPMMLLLSARKLPDAT